MINIGLIIHGPYCRTTETLIKNAKKVFKKNNIVYVISDNSFSLSNINDVKVLKVEDPGELTWLGRKAKNLYRHMENVRKGSEYFQSYDYLFKVRSDLNLNKNDLLRLKAIANENIDSLIKVRNFSFYIPFHDLDFIYGAPANIMKKSSELILFKIEELFQTFLYNRNRVFPSAKFIFNSEMIIDLSLWATINNISLENLKKLSPLYNYKYLFNKEKTIYLSLNQLRIFPKRLSILNGWYIKTFLINYLYPKLTRNLNKLIFKLQIR